MAGLRLFETALGTCGIAWSDEGLIACTLPPGDEGRLKRALSARRLPEDGEPPAFAAIAIAGISALFTNGRANLTALPLDWGASQPFERSVYELTRAIPPGRTRTYGDLARDMGSIALARKVGQALGANPWPIVVPCHRVVGQAGALTGFSAPGGVATKRKLLALEGARVVAQRELF